MSRLIDGVTVNDLMLCLGYLTSDVLSSPSPPPHRLAPPLRGVARRSDDFVVLLVISDFKRWRTAANAALARVMAQEPAFGADFATCPRHVAKAASAYALAAYAASGRKLPLAEVAAAWPADKRVLFESMIDSITCSHHGDTGQKLNTIKS